MTDKIRLDDNSRYVKRLHSRVMRKRRVQIALLTLVIAAGLVWVSMTAFNALKDFKLPVIVPAKQTVQKKKPKPKTTIALIGVEQREYEQYVSGVTALVYDPNKKKINGLAFDKDIRMQIPGYGLDAVEKLLFAGTDSALSAITNVIGIKIDKYVMIDIDDYSTKKAATKKIFSSIIETNLSVKEQDDLEAKFKKIDVADINILEAPSRLIAVGKEPYKQAKKNEVKRLVKVLWDLPKPLNRPRVIVLNGVGASGLAGKVAMKIIDSKYEVIDIKNAKSFNYKNTLIIVYAQKFQDEAMSIRKALGYGKIMLDPDKQGLTDITVIIGKDNKEK